MKNLTQKALMIVLTVFVLVGLFYGLSTPVKTSAKVPAISQDGPDPIPTCPPTGQCAK